MIFHKKMKSTFELALITGASSGIGKELASQLAEKGIDLILVARSRDKLEALAERLSNKVNVEVVVADLADQGERTQVIRKIHEKAPDLVINNAGWGYYGEALSYRTEDSMNILEVDVAALLEITLEAARTLVSKEKQGTIMNVSSVAAFQIFPCLSVYAACKAFVNLFSESFDEEVKPHGIRVLACCPGMVDTRFRHRASGGEDVEANSFSMTVEFAAKEIWKQVQSGKPIHAFDWKYRLTSFLTKYLLPKKFIAAAVRRNIEQRHSPREIIKL